MSVNTWYLKKLQRLPSIFVNRLKFNRKSCVAHLRPRYYGFIVAKVCSQITSHNKTSRQRKVTPALTEKLSSAFVQKDSCRYANTISLLFDLASSCLEALSLWDCLIRRSRVSFDEFLCKSYHSWDNTNAFYLVVVIAPLSLTIFQYSVVLSLPDWIRIFHNESFTKWKLQLQPNTIDDDWNLESENACNILE